MKNLFKFIFVATPLVLLHILIPFYVTDSSGSLFGLSMPGSISTVLTFIVYLLLAFLVSFYLFKWLKHKTNISKTYPKAWWLLMTGSLIIGFLLTAMTSGAALALLFFGASGASTSALYYFLIIIESLLFPIQLGIIGGAFIAYRSKSN
ncbi:MAG: hypothetical protein R3B38_00280 [Patescibacteria group bacterium]